MKIKKNDINFVVEQANHIQQITKELYIDSPIHYFNYVRVYPNGDRITLSDNPSWMDVFLNEAPKHRLIFENSDEAPHFRYNIWDNCDGIYESELVNAGKNQFDLDHGLTIIEKNKDFLEYYYFCAPSNNHLTNQYYINNLERLEFFTQYFKIRASTIVSAAEKRKFNFGGPIQPKILDTGTGILNFNLKKYVLHLGNSSITLSRRELECLAFRMSGLTAKESACLLGINVRTIEKYNEVLRLKIGVYPNYKLLKIFSTMDINMFLQVTRHYVIKYYENKNHID